MPRSTIAMPRVPMIALTTRVSPEVALAVGKAAREAKLSESDLLRRIVLEDATVSRHLGDPAQRRRFQR